MSKEENKELVISYKGLGYSKTKLSSEILAHDLRAGYFRGVKDIKIVVSDSETHEKLFQARNKINSLRGLVKDLQSRISKAEELLSGIYNPDPYTWMEAKRAWLSQEKLKEEEELK